MTLASRKGKRWRPGNNDHFKEALALNPGLQQKAGRHLSPLESGYPKAPWQLCSKGSFIEAFLGRHEGSPEASGGPRGWCWWPTGLWSTPYQFLASFHEAASHSAPGLRLWGAGAPMTASQGGVTGG